MTFAYDPFGRRIAKTADGVTTLYTYDGEDILFETVNGAAGNVYVHGPGIDEPLALLGKKETTYYHADGLGSIVAMTDGQARSVQQYEYDSFGNQHDMKNRIKQPYGYTGREHDRETGLKFYRARYYDGEVGLFLGKDPISFSAGNVNLYSYVRSNTINYIDPYGLIESQLFNLPTFSEAYPASDYAALIADIVAGGIEGGITVAAGVVTAVTYAAGPEMWPITIITAPLTLEAGLDSFSRITTGIDRLINPVGTKPSPCP